MFDAQIRPMIDQLLNPVGRALVRLGVTANQVTLAGAGFGLPSRS
ncbi:MAG: CDP-alcohol phosphatidyltransferase family protein, partial [Alphaproteobacteria bacterium]|nr:CDP-alcohol phosphatidyltransferase family protein [Alphaproteobacteria bacterium]